MEAFEHLSKQVHSVEQRRILQNESILGGEAKSLPYLLSQMNLLLHGLESPRIDYGNALRFRLSEIGEGQRVDIILTNPPFGGEEERGILGNFPADKQTAETALLFLQLIMRKLKRQPNPHGRFARAAIVVPNGTLFADGVAARIKAELLTEFNLHTIVRLPNGVFRLTLPSPPTSCFLIAAILPVISGIMRSHCRRVKRTTPRLSPCPMRHLRTASPGGMSAPKTTAPGRFPPLS